MTAWLSGDRPRLKIPSTSRFWSMRPPLRTWIDQATAIRASVRTADGVWHVGSTYIDAAGGGCTAPAAAYANSDWYDKLGEIHGQVWPASGRARMVVDHPMDTGLAGDIPVFIIEDLHVRDDA